MKSLLSSVALVTLANALDAFAPLLGKAK